MLCLMMSSSVLILQQCDLSSLISHYTQKPYGTVSTWPNMKKDAYL